MKPIDWRKWDRRLAGAIIIHGILFLASPLWLIIWRAVMW